MEEDTNLNVLSCIHWQVVIELGSFLVKLDQQELVNPVDSKIHNHSEWVQNWNTG
jgi:hypothetical protein